MALLLSQKVLHSHGRQIIVEFLENFVLKRLLTMSVPFGLKRLVVIVSVTQKEPQAISRRIQIRR